MGGTSLVVQWIRIRLPMQGMQVQSLVHVPQVNLACAQLLTRHLKPVPCNKKNHCNEKPHSPQLAKGCTQQ